MPAALAFLHNALSSEMVLRALPALQHYTSEGASESSLQPVLKSSLQPVLSSGCTAGVAVICFGDADVATCCFGDIGGSPGGRKRSWTTKSRPTCIKATHHTRCIQ